MLRWAQFLKKIIFWWKQELKFSQFLRRLDVGEIDDSSEDVLVLVCPWVWTTVPWYSICLGLLLLDSKKVKLLVDDVFKGPDKFSYGIQLQSIKRIVKLLNGFKNLQVMYLSNFEPVNERTIPKDKIFQYSMWNATHELKGEMQTKGRKDLTEKLHNSFLRAYPRVESCLISEDPTYILVPGGIKNSSGVFDIICKKNGKRMASFDSGPVSFLVSTDGVTPHLFDIKKSYDKFQSEESSKEVFRNMATEESLKRLGGTSVYSYQNDLVSNESYKKFENSVLIALNSSWDTAALGLHQVFGSTTEWIVESIEFILKNTDKNVILRQHPVEKFDYAKTSDNYIELINKNFEKSDRVIVLDAFAKENTYKILPYVDLLLVYTSTIALEATFIGVPTITVSNNYYSKMGFIENAMTKKDYFSKIVNVVEGRSQVTPDQKNSALDCYFLTQCCNWSFTEFNPCANFYGWVEQGFDEIKKMSDVDLILKCVDENVPFSWLKYKQIKESIDENS